MRSIYIIILLVILGQHSSAQQGFAFTHITTDDGTGLASNLVTSLYQDEKGFIWVGTANGLQRFDGSKFIHISTTKPGSDPLLYQRISQIIPADSGKLVLVSFALREFGLFDPSTFMYKKITLKTSKALSPRSEFRLWKDSKGDIYLNVQGYAILHYNKKTNTFDDDRPFPFPTGWTINILASYENASRQQYWFGCDSGLCIYDVRSKQMWYRNNNPRNIAVLKNKHVQDGITKVYIDKQQRIWLFSYPRWGNGGQYKFCMDSTGSNYLKKDTTGLNRGLNRDNDYRQLYETSQGELWIYGLNILLKYDKNAHSFYYFRKGSENNNIDFETVFQLMEDKDNNLWLATNQGVYYTAAGTANSAMVNVAFNNSTGPTSISDILEVPGGELWFTSLKGVTTTDKFLRKTQNSLYKQSPPAIWPQTLKTAIKETYAIYRQSATGKIWIGCSNGVLMIHDPVKKTTEYWHAPEFDNSIIRYITEDKQGQLWFGTQTGKLIKWSNNMFTVVQDVGTIIYKVFVDRQGWLWLATREGGLYAADPADGKILQHYTTNNGKNSLYSNTGLDIEQLKNDVIVYAGGALHFIDKKTGAVSILKYEDGLPSNTVSRLRTDEKGFLWIITSNGLCRYNPNNKHITPYGRKDGVILAEQTIAADFRTENDNIIFGGSNCVVMFNPEIFSSTQPPQNVTITDFKVFNQFLPVDSLLRNTQIKLNYDENSFSIYFASLSYRQRDKLTYYYKMQGIDKVWIKGDRSFFVNYSLLPPGKYTFNIYCENIEGLRSNKITSLSIFIKPQFWRTWWFISSLLFIVAVLIYEVHKLRVNRLMAVEALRNRVARDLHDDMGSTLSTINILSSMAKAKINESAVKTSEYLSKISEYSEKMMDTMDDIVWSIKPSNDSMIKITSRMREFATNVLEPKEIDFDFTINEDIYDIKLNMEARRDFFLIFKEAVNNAAKYSKADKVEIELNIQNKKLLLLVRDDGTGFDFSKADGNGLGNMKKRADNVNGYVTIQSSKGKGTIVKLIIPVLF